MHVYNVLWSSSPGALACPTPGDPLFFTSTPSYLTSFLCTEVQLPCDHGCNSQAVSGRQHSAILLPILYSHPLSSHSSMLWALKVIIKMSYLGPSAQQSLMLNIWPDFSLCTNCLPLQKEASLVKTESSTNIGINMNIYKSVWQTYR